jgi:hypothetical protein
VLRGLAQEQRRLEEPAAWRGAGGVAPGGGGRGSAGVGQEQGAEVASPWRGRGGSGGGAGVRGAGSEDSSAPRLLEELAVGQRRLEERVCARLDAAQRAADSRLAEVIYIYIYIYIYMR